MSPSSHTHDLTVIVTAHAEGTLAHRTMRSLRRAVDKALSASLRVELLVVLDSPNDATKKYFRDYWDSEIRIEVVAALDVGSARNYGVSIASGEFVTFLDADDLICESWFERGVAHLRQLGTPNAVCVPAYSIGFEAVSLIHRHIGSCDPTFSLADLVENNFWTSVMIAPRALLRSHPYSTAKVSDGFGYEDWHWYCNLLDGNGEVVVAPETALFVRRKAKNSRLMLHNEHRALLRPTPLFAPARFASEHSRRAEKRPDRAAFPNVPAPPAPLPARVGWSRFAYAKAKAFVRLFPNSKPFLKAVYRRLVRYLQSPYLASDHLRWLIEEWRCLHKIEPQLFPDQETFSGLIPYQVWSSRLGVAYAQLCQELSQAFTHVMLVPWLRTGGVDLETLNYIKHLSKRVPAERILVLATQPFPSPWASRLPAGVAFFNTAEIFGHLTLEEQKYTLGTYLVQLAPDVIHNMNSPLGYRVFADHGRALRHASELFVSVFCTDQTEDGRHVGCAVNDLPNCFDSLSAVFSDSRQFLEQLENWFAIDSSKCHVHYQPVPSTNRTPRRPTAQERPIRVLWAGRLDRQKRPDVLMAIAKRASGLPVEFHVYGHRLLDDMKFEKQLKAPNVVYHGGYDGFSALPIEEYDLFLNTSQWDGMPNIILEAMSCGLPVLTSPAGGIPEAVENGVTGLLVDRVDDVDQYVQAIEKLIADPGLFEKLGERGRKLMRQRHSEEAFDRTVNSLPEYYGRYSDHPPKYQFTTQRPSEPHREPLRSGETSETSRRLEWTS